MGRWKVLKVAAGVAAGWLAFARVVWAAVRLRAAVEVPGMDGTGFRKLAITSQGNRVIAEPTRVKSVRIYPPTVP